MPIEAIIKRTFYRKILINKSEVIYGEQISLILHVVVDTYI